MEEKPVYHLEPGHIYASSVGHVIRTVLGSCVSVCLWDNSLKTGGMNHFMYPCISGREKGSAKYGNAAIPALISMMNELGCSNKNMTAQLYGGADPSGDRGNSSGAKNIALARKVLELRGLNVVSEDVGGRMGRKILFDTFTGHAVVLKVHELRQEDWVGRE